MGLISCAKCGALIGDRVIACPSCGASGLEATQPKETDRAWLIAGALVVAVVAFLAFDHFLDDYLGGLQKPGAPPAAPTAERSPEGNRTVAEIAYIELNEGRIRQRLKDPETATFRDVRVYYAVAPVVCGEVNARNSFGGAGGFQRFVSGGSIQAVAEDMAPGEMAKTWDRLCR